MKLPLIPLDKANHIIYGLLIYIIANLFVENILAFGVVALGAGKELYDYKSYGKFDVLDLLATISAALVLTILY